MVLFLARAFRTIQMYGLRVVRSSVRCHGTRLTGGGVQVPSRIDGGVALGA